MSSRITPSMPPSPLLPDALCRVRFRAAIPERDKHVEDGVLEETVVSFEEPAEQLFC